MSSLESLLKDCTVRLKVLSEEGTGFFVGVGKILTCHHLVESAGEEGVEVCWRNKKYKAVVERSSAKLDLALLTVIDNECSNNEFVYLDEEFRPFDPIYIFGYPDNCSNGASTTAMVEGPATLGELPVIKFKDGQIRPGYSGSPVLNWKTGKVCGIVKSTRGRGSDLGGEAIQAQLIFQKFCDNISPWQQSIQEPNSLWMTTLHQHKIESIPLDSSKGIDYKPLRDLLIAKKWEEADEATWLLLTALIIPAIVPEEAKWTSWVAFTVRTIAFNRDFSKLLPSDEIKIVDELWTEASKGMYGFSAQKLIYAQCQSNWNKFCHKVAWKSDNKWVDVSLLKWDNSAVHGHIPCKPVWQISIESDPDMSNTFIAKASESYLSSLYKSMLTSVMKICG